MAINNKKLGSIYPDKATYTSIYSPSGVKGAVRGLNICNLTSVVKYVRLSNPSDGENATNVNRYVLYDYQIPANSSISLKYMITMEASDALQLYTNATGVSAVAWGLEKSGIGEDIGLLGGVSPTANINTVLYTVGADRKANISTLNVCNRSSSKITYSIAHNDTNATAIASGNYIAYDQEIFPNDSIPFSLPISMVASDAIIVNCASPVLTFMCWGSEVF